MGECTTTADHQFTIRTSFDRNGRREAEARRYFHHGGTRSKEALLLPSFICFPDIRIHWTENVMDGQDTVHTFPPLPIPIPFHLLIQFSHSGCCTRKEKPTRYIS